MGFDFEIQYRPGLENKAADALSRCVLPSTLSSLILSTMLVIAAITQQVHQDPHLNKLKQDLAHDPSSHPHFPLEQGRLLYKGKLVLPKDSTFIPLLLKEFHNISVVGHSRILRTYKRIIADVYWSGMKHDVRKFVEECSICHQNKLQALAPASSHSFYDLGKYNYGLHGGTSYFRWL